MLRACSWFGFVVNIERMTHSSSATVARFGSSSLISMPAFPCLANVNFVGMSPAVVRSVRRSAVAGRWPAYFISAGFGSHRSTCDGPPVMNSRMTCLAFGAKCGPTVCVPAAKRVSGEQIGEPEHADAAAHALQRFAPREFFYGQKITSLVESSACA